MGRHRAVSDADWNQLITLASGYLALESGDIHAAMQRALSAHMDLIAALKSGQISAEIPEGTVTMFVPDEGGVALRLEPATDPTEAPALPGAAPDAAASAADDGGITEVAAPPQLDVEPPGPHPLESELAEGPTDRGDAGRTFTFEEDET